MTPTTMLVDPSNAEQARIWDGDEGAYWATHAAHYDRTVAAYQRPFFDAAAIQATDRVLDIGCGNGETTRHAARIATAGSVLGVDLSARMVERARKLAAESGLGNATFAQVDAQVHPFDEASVDVAISRTGAMFFGDPGAAFGNIARTVRPGGRFVSLHWRSIPENEWFVDFTTTLAAGRGLPQPPPTAPSPFALADPERTTSLLEAAGFSNCVHRPLDAEMWFGADADDAQQFILGFLGWVLNGLDNAGRTRAVDDLHATLAAHQTDNGVVYRSAAWLVTATRR
jgi:SAM-dependent methyltransferase